MRGIHGGPKPIQSITSTGRPVKTTLSGDRPPDGEPCVVVISMGKQQGGAAAKALKARAISLAADRNYPCMVIDIGQKLYDADKTLRQDVPEGAYIVLVDAEALEPEVQVVRTALQSRTILDVVQSEGEDPPSHTAFSNLQNLPPYLRQPAESSSGADPASPSTTFLPQPHTAFPNLESLPPYVPQAVERLPGTAPATSSTTLGSDGWQVPETRYQEYIQERNWQLDRASSTQYRTNPSPIDPAKALCDALGLEEGLFRQWDERHDLPLLANLVRKALTATRTTNLKPMLRHLVEQMAARPDLAKRVFGVLQGGDASCGDRVSLALFRALEELIVQPVIDGDLNQDLWKVVDIARKVFRRKWISQWADEKVSAINEALSAQGLAPHDEDVETHLHLFSELHEPLELGGQKLESKFTFLSGLTGEDIEAARNAVLMREGEQEQEGKNFWAFLATWDPWQKVMRNLFPHAVAEIENELADMDRLARITREATAEAVRAIPPGDEREKAITRALGQAGKEDTLRLWLSLTKNVLRNQGS